MHKSFDKEICPACGSVDYTVDDYNDNFDIDGGSQWWYCRCNKCGLMFDIERLYELVDISVTKSHYGN